jgi:hypothetical protein
MRSISVLLNVLLAAGLCALPTIAQDKPLTVSAELRFPKSRLQPPDCHDACRRWHQSPLRGRAGGRN